MIGVGLNLTIAPDEFPPELRDTAISLFAPIERGQGRGPPEPPRCRSGGLPSTRLAQPKR